ncbi:acetoacetate decarboxylase family protein [Luteolibacter flavescens]|uniref:Acetoacetate decarboxylase family protein n=1 Tax=Luteolibacter flavescens TaxID=1859460 RepID=A0ABT3FP49_9BACT|nr:acetoacetate decarboxylase family protein [Luteolibacter flavescens]MCW1885350.1 acetoacetate decarboxylase family protein [Luteolibacter flavescens]
MIPYTERDTDLNFSPPYRITGVEALSAVRRIDTGVAQDWLDQTLNWRPGKEEAKPKFTALPIAFIIFMHMKAMRSTKPPFNSWGSVSETEMVVTLPVLEWDNEGFISVPSLKFYPIVLCLDSGPALISGREVFGFPKILGQVELNAHGGVARTEVCRAEGEPATDRDGLLLALRRDKEDGPPSSPDSFNKGLVEMVKEELLTGMDRGVLGHLLNFNPARKMLNLGLEWVVEAFEGLDIGQKFVFLKQFRDVANPAYACHRSVAECLLEFSHLESLTRETGDWELEVPEWRSSRLLKRLGVDSGPIGAPLRSSFQIDMSVGKTLWSS